MDKTFHELAVEAYDHHLAPSFEVIRWLETNGIIDPGLMRDVVTEYWRMSMIWFVCISSTALRILS